MNINRNNAKGNGGVYGTKGDYTGNMTDAQCADVVKHWKTDFYDKYGKKPVAFVWDDGWDAALTAATTGRDKAACSSATTNIMTTL